MDYKIGLRSYIIPLYNASAWVIHKNNFNH